MNKKRKIIRIGIAVLLVIVVLFLGSKLLTRQGDTQGASTGIAFEKKSQNVNREFTFPIKSNDVEVSKIKFSIEKAETLDEIVVKGQKAKAVAGRMFLIINIKIVNDYNKSIEINTKDYLRLIVNKNEGEFLAPDIHNDPVEVQAISTKYSRVGFPVNTSDNDFTLQIGEIKGDKQKVELKLE